MNSWNFRNITEPRHTKTALMAFVNSDGQDEHAQLRMLILAITDHLEK